MLGRFSLKFSKLNTVQWIFITFLAFILLSFRTVQLPNIFVSSSRPNYTRRAWRTCLCHIVVINYAKKRGDQSHDRQVLPAALKSCVQLICNRTQKKPPVWAASLASTFGCGGRIWTYDLQVMSLIPGHNDINDLPENVRNLGTVEDGSVLIWT